MYDGDLLLGSLKHAAPVELTISQLLPWTSLEAVRTMPAIIAGDNFMLQDRAQTFSKNRSTKFHDF